MLKFEHPEALYLLFLLVPLAGIFAWFMYGRRQAIRRMGMEDIVEKLMPMKPTYKHPVKFGLVFLATTSLIIALANPQLGKGYEKVKRSGVDLVIALDISRSMLAEDVKPSRLEQARQFISRLTEELAGDRVALIIFAGNSYLQMPLTSDYVAAKTFLKTINTGLAPTQGTAIGEAIRMADESFDQGDPQFKVVLVISDGENHEGDALEAAEEVAAKNVVIYTMGVGTPKGGPIPEIRGGQVDYKRDQAGSIVLSKLNETMLQQVAATGNGEYFRMRPGSGLVDEVMDRLARVEKKDFEERVFTDYEDQFQWFLAIAVLLITLDFFITERKSMFWSDWAIFKEKEKTS